MADQLSMFDLIPDAPEPTGVTIRIKYADRSDPRRRGTVRINTTKTEVLDVVHKWRQENKTKFYYLGHEED